MGGGRQLLKSGSENRTNDPVDAWACARSDNLDLIQAWKDDKAKRNATWKLLENSKDLKTLDWTTDYVMGAS